MLREPCTQLADRFFLGGELVSKFLEDARSFRVAVVLRSLSFSERLLRAVAFLCGGAESRVEIEYKAIENV